MKYYCVSKKNIDDIQKILASKKMDYELNLYLNIDLNLENIPINITNLTLREKKQKLFYNIPTHINYLKIKIPCNAFDKNLFSNTNLIFLKSTYFNQEPSEHFFPVTLKILNLGKKFNKILYKNVLPDNLEELYFGNKYNQEIKENILPESLIKIVFGEYFCHKLSKKNLPKNLLELHLGGRYNFDINNELPDKLEKLYLSNNFNVEIYKNTLPQNLTTLKFGHMYNKNISNNIFPDSLKFLYLSNNFNGTITKENLSPNLEELNYQTYQICKYNRYMFNVKILSVSNNLKKLVINNIRMSINADLFVESIEELTLNVFSIDFSKIFSPINLKNINICTKNVNSCTITFPNEMDTIALYNINLKNIKFPLKLKNLIVSDLTNLNCKLSEELSSLTINSKINVDSLPLSLKVIIFEQWPEVVTTNLPLFLETIQIKSCNRYYINDYYKNELITVLPKLPHGCKLIDKYNNEIIF